MSGKNKRILIITERYAPEPFLITDLAETWVKQGKYVVVTTQIPSYPGDKIYYGYKNKKTTEIINNVRIIRFPTVIGYSKNIFFKMLNYFLFMIREVIYAFIQSKNVDEIFVYHTGPLTQALAIIPIKIFRKLKITIWTQDVWPDAVFAYGFPQKGLFAFLLKQFVKIIYKYCDNIFVSSPGFIKRLKPYVKGKNIEFIPQWVPDEVINSKQTSLVINDTRMKFIFTGNIGSMQALDVVIKAFASLNHEQFVLYILGDGNKRKEYEQLVESLCVKNIIFYDRIPQNQVLSCIKQCDYSLLSLSSNKLISLTIPAKFQTYLAAGKPIVAITEGEISRLVFENDIGISCHVNERDIFKKICQLPSPSDHKYEKWIQNIKKIQNKFQKETIIQKINSAMN
ncbi:glycosyltransferase family 4 protein [Gracilinema caldarium]|uniref:glycosyltransferase family 4 protein n=1 Tax=Gracilinema caldarium TaxID=215591 RepID=UPI0026F2E9E6|nr:glycosyltransferase family 4 protein [Gracilinema caldarium]